MTQLEITKLYKDTFDNDTGRKCLAHMKSIFVDKPVYKEGQTFEQTAFREGRRDIVMQIIKEVENGR